MGFFQAWDPVPPQAGKPGDTALEQRIAKLAEFAAKNGPPFVDMLREKQQHNPDYSFLNGGVGSDYFKWMLYCILYKLDAEQPLQLSEWQVAPHQFQQALPAPTPTAAMNGTQDLFAAAEELQKTASEMSPDLDRSFASILSTLNSTRASIKEGKEWFMGRAAFASALAAKMALHQRTLRSYEQQICVIYLANDVLLKSLNNRVDGTDPGEDVIAAAFRKALPIMLHTAFVSGSSSPEVHQRLTTILDHWAARSIYSPQTVAFMKEAMVRGPENAILPPEPQMPPALNTHAHMVGPGNDRWPPGNDGTQERTWMGNVEAGQPLSHMFPQQPQQAMQPQGQMSWNPAGPPMGIPGVPDYGPPAGFPGHMQPAGQPAHPPVGFPNQLPFLGQPQIYDGMAGLHPGLPPGTPSWPHSMPPSGPPIPDEPVMDPMSFPPGLLPALVKEHLRTEESYHPLERQEVMAAGIPEPAAVDAYLTARLEKLAAEIRDHRPGTSRADLEGDEKRQKTRNNLGEVGQGKYGRTLHEEKPKYDDGSFKGERQAEGPAGLGFGTVSEGNPDDPFNQYRKKRSGYYHDSLSRAQAAAAAKLQTAT